MKLSDFDYNLPKQLIAQKPVRPRDHSRLMILSRKNKTIRHDYFYNLGKYLKRKDILVINDSKVIPAKLFGKKQTGGKTEILLLKRIKNNTWEALVKKGKENQIIKINSKFKAEVLKKIEPGIWKIKFNFTSKKLEQAISRFGKAPTPPYIKRLSNLKEYQTIYAKRKGSIAAPTAGFHFTKNLISKLKKQDIKFYSVTLHVGLGTFQPVRTEIIEKHKMHSELAEVKKEIAKKLNQAKKNNQRIIAVGTTTVRTLETFTSNKILKPGIKYTNLFIYPGYKFKFVDAMITNFHLPKSTLLMLVCAFASRKLIFKAYKEAIKKKYRFYSFGDAMLII
ncbi:tRNA preQ1(34) S-adenosylmethionine ribosyltransferase-isomerase QueA [bacterium]|nr:tRNA preQ1(34) S-adenosylmethionine ribosyltransferase-isomerase QueA [bacterium]